MLLRRPLASSRHRLWSELGRYLIVFEPPTFALDQRARSGQTLSPQFVLRRSKNFTSNAVVRMAPVVPLIITSSSMNQQNRTEVLFHYSMHTHSNVDASALSTLISSK